MMSFMGPMACLFSNRCWAILGLPYPFLNSRRCSRKRVLNDLPVYPVYFMLQEGQVIWYIPDFLYLLLWGGWWFPISSFFNVFLLE